MICSTFLAVQITKVVTGRLGSEEKLKSVVSGGEQKLQQLI